VFFRITKNTIKVLAIDLVKDEAGITDLQWCRTNLQAGLSCVISPHPSNLICNGKSHTQKKCPAFSDGLNFFTVT